MTIRTLDDVTLVPTSVTYTQWIGGKSVDSVRDEMRAILLSKMESQPVTVIDAIAMTGEPYCRTGHFVSATIGPRSAGGNSEWQLSLAWKSANRSGTEEALKPTLAKTQQRIILEQDGALAESNKRISALQKQFEDHDWNAAQELDQLNTALVKKLKTRTAREQAAPLKQLGESLGFADMLKVLGR